MDGGRGGGGGRSLDEEGPRHSPRLLSRERTNRASAIRSAHHQKRASRIRNHQIPCMETLPNTCRCANADRKNSPSSSWSRAKLTPPLQRLHRPSKRMTGLSSDSKTESATDLQSHPTPPSLSSATTAEPFSLGVGYSCASPAAAARCRGPAAPPARGRRPRPRPIWSRLRGVPLQTPAGGPNPNAGGRDGEAKARAANPPGEDAVADP